MRIAIIASEFVPTIGGIGTYSTSLVRQLARRHEIEVHVFTPNRKRSGSDELELEELKKLANVHFVSNARDFFLFNFWFQKKLPFVFNRLDKENNFDLIHSMNLTGVPDIFLMLGKRRKPSIVTVHSTIETQLQGIRDSGAGFFELQEVEKYSIIFSRVIRKLQALYLERTKNIIAVSDFIKKQIMEKEEVSVETKITVVHNGIDTEKFSSKSNANERILPESIAGGKTAILFFGRLLASKGLQTLLDAAPAILNECRDVLFVFAGSGNSRYWQEKARRKRIGKDCAFLGALSHNVVPALLNESGIIVLPSFSESFPLTILEAMSCSKPVIASNVGGIPEIITDGSNGLLFEKGDSEALARKLIQLVQNDNEKKRLGRNARKTIAERFTEERMAEQTISAYDMALE